MRIGALVLIVLISIALRPAGAVDWGQAQTITMVTSEYRFMPSQLTFRQGVPYRLHLENHGKEMHEFTAPDFIKSLRIRNPKVLNADRTEVGIQPGAAKDFYFVPKTAGHYPLICGDHDWAGMTGNITVE
jgi:uncharacterized cupredoxin-like copper-binding protein